MPSPYPSELGQVFGPALSRFVLATSGVLLACGGTNHGPAVAGTPESPTGGTVSQESADTAVVERLTSARCEQEQGCKNVGPQARYASLNVCTDQVRGGIGNELNAYNCPRGLDSAAVDRCVAAIQSEECGRPFDTLTRFDKCRTGVICMK